MNGRSRGIGLAAVLLGLTLSAGCGQDSPDEPPATEPPATEPPATEPMTPEQVASSLVVASDLGADWSVTQMPDFPELSESGVVSDEVQDMLPRPDLCEAAGDEAQESADALEWDAYRQLDFATGTPTGTPSPGVPPVHHLVFAQEYLASGEPDEVETTYDALVAGGDACLGTEETPDGETVRTTSLEVPELGDASHGWRAVVTEPGPAGRSATWDLRQVLVRDGAVLLLAQVAEITTPRVETVLDDAQVDGFLQTMVDKLP